MRRAWLLLLLVPWLRAQQGVGRLYYATPSGRALALRVVAAGADRLSLAAETGDAERLRAWVAAHAGAQAQVAPGARTLADPVPQGWRGGTGGTALVRNSEATYWRHAPGQVVPARFQALGQTWQLLTAELPPGRHF